MFEYNTYGFGKQGVQVEFKDSLLGAICAAQRKSGNALMTGDVSFYTLDFAELTIGTPVNASLLAFARWTVEQALPIAGTGITDEIRTLALKSVDAQRRFILGEISEMEHDAVCRQFQSDRVNWSNMTYRSASVTSETRFDAVRNLLEIVLETFGLGSVVMRAAYASSAAQYLFPEEAEAKLRELLGVKPSD